MDQETKHEFEEIALIIRDSFSDLEQRMATKDDLRALESRVDSRFADMESRMATKDDLNELGLKLETGFSFVQAELNDIKAKIKELEYRIERLFRTETEDTSALSKDLVDLKKRVERIEKNMQLQYA